MRQKVEILLSGAWRGENGELVFNGYRVSVGGYEPGDEWRRQMHNNTNELNAAELYT